MTLQNHINLYFPHIYMRCLEIYDYTEGEIGEYTYKYRFSQNLYNRLPPAIRDLVETHHANHLKPVSDEQF